MVDQIADQLKRYWVIIITVAILAFGLGSANALMLYRLNEMGDDLAAFIAEGPRYSLKDHIQYADRQMQVDNEQDRDAVSLERRVTILEQRELAPTR